MGSKNLFDKGAPYQILKSSDLQGVSKKVESSRNVRAKAKQRERFIPRTDFSDPVNFARFGSAEQYYEDAFDRVLAEFPYDGSEAEQTEFYNSSSYLDLYVFDKEYPRTTGFVTLHAAGYAPGADAIDGWKVVPPVDKEYIVIRGGPHTASGGMASGSLATQFSGANYYDTDIYNTNREYQGDQVGTRLSNLRYSLTDGVSIEFWIKKDAWGEGGDTDDRNKTAIFDLWNGNITGSTTSATTFNNSQYGRLLVYLSASGDDGAGSGGNYPIGVHVASGSTVWDLKLGSTITTSSIQGNWEHFAISLQSSSVNSSLEAKFYHSGAFIEASSSGDIGTFGEVTGSLVAYLGALQTSPSGNAFKDFVSPNTTYRGYGGLEASLDEFRYWKTHRTAEDIGLNYFRQIRGGTNTDPANADLGVYYKFNEGTTGTNSVDSIVLDYSGRISNGEWVGYPGSTARNTGSAMVSASAIVAEWEDPIIREQNSLVTDARNNLIQSGTVFDYTNNAMAFNRMPGWVQDEDNGTLKQMLQIMSSYMDSLHLQIEDLPSLKDASYVSGSDKAIPIANRLVSNYGMDAPEIFADADILAQIMSRDEVRNFELDIGGIKDRIYKNIYNNLVHIYKTKGTLKSFRNLIRCYGVGDDVVKLNLYGNNTTHKIRNNYDPTVSRKNYINFNHPDSFGGVVTQQSAALGVFTPTFVSGAVNEYLATTAELDVIFPKMITDRANLGWFDIPFVSSSIFGTHVPHDSSPLCYRQITTNSDCSWGVYAVRTKQESPDAHFVFKSHRSGTPDFHLTSAVYPNVYDNQRWNFAVRTKNIKYPVSDVVSGSDAGSSTDFDIDDTYTVLELYAVNYEGGILRNEFCLTSSALSRIEYLTSPHRYYVGAERTNWTGSLNTQTDIRASSLKHWESYVEDDAIKAHAKDPKNYGALRPGRSAYLMQSALTGTSVPESQTLALRWDFDNVTGSDSTGGLIVEDGAYPVLTTIQDDLVSRYHDNQNNPQFANTVGYSYDGQAYHMQTSNTGAVDRAYIDSQRQNPPESLSAQDTVSILTLQDEVEFTRDTRPINYYFSFEKSMYATITQEIMNFFGSVVEYNELIGNPVNRYRQDYKELGKLRELFFEKVGNTPDLDKYIDYYKWIDQSLSVMLQQLVPATADFSDGIRTMVESHALERNKYWNKFPTLEMKVTDPEAAVRGITELKYDWEHGHAPVMAKAVATTECQSSSNGDYNNDTITFTDGAGKTIVYKYTNSSGGVATGGLNTDGSVSIKVNGLAANVGSKAAELATAFNGVNGHGTNGLNTISCVTTDLTNGINTYTQLIAGTTGNTNTPSSDAVRTEVTQQFTGGTGGQSDNCMWWDERAERDKNNASAAPGGASAAINTDREAQREIIETYRTGSPGPTLAQSTKTLPTTTYQGSTYALRRFDEIYNFIVDESPLYHGGPDYSQRKRYGFITPQIRTITSNTNQSLIVIEDVDYGKDCDDAIVPPELDKKKLSYGYSPLSGKSINLTDDNYTLKGVGDIYTPFSLYSSSVESGYQGSTALGPRALTDIVSGNITNYHHDIVGPDMDVPMQGPFTEKYVGGNQWRHQDLVHDPATTGSANGSHRAEGWDLSTSPSNKLILESRKRFGTLVGMDQWAVWKRDVTAKRPVNLQNIQMTASDIGAYKTTLPADAGTDYGPTPTEFISGTLRSNIGNFENFYDIVQTSGRSINNAALTENDGFSKATVSPTAQPYTQQVVGTLKPQRGKHEHVFVQRFSAPGGPDTAGDANGGFGLDFESAEFSPYNALPFRNTTVRTPLNRTLLVNHARQFGLYSGSVMTSADVSMAINLTGSYQKANRNTLLRPELTGTTGPTNTWDAASAYIASNYDNGWVTHEIPRMETSYAWIADSLVQDLAYGHGHPDGTYSNSSGIHSSIDFVSSSAVASYGGGSRRYGVDYLVGDGDGATEIFQTTHLNTNIVEPLSASEATLGYKTTTPVGFYVNYTDIDVPPRPARAFGGLIDVVVNNSFTTASVLHDLNIQRNGYYGYPSWKQTRTGEHKLARHYRNENTITINPSPGGTLTVADGEETITTRFGAFQSFVEPAVDTAAPLAYSLGLEKRVGTAPDGAPMYDIIPVPMIVSYANMLTRFSNNSLEELVSINPETPYLPYDRLKKTYLNGALGSPSSPVKSFLGMTFNSPVYPASYNMGLEKVRERENFKIKFWADARDARTTLGAEKSSSMGAPYFGKFSPISQSAWALDAGLLFSEPTASTAYWQSASAAGELQNPYNMVHGGVYSQETADGGFADINGKQYITASVLYARKHMIFATASTVAATLDNPQTGGLGNSIPALRAGDPVIFTGQAEWQAATLAGRVKTETILVNAGTAKESSEIVTSFESDIRYPIEPDYERNMMNPIVKNKKLSLIPEFRISQHIEKYAIQQDPLIANDALFEIYGASGSLPSSSAESGFYKTFSNTDFMKHFEMVYQDHKDFKTPSTITLTCQAIKKFLPYDGFYPAQRTVDIASQFSKSYGEFVNTQGGIDGFASDSDKYPSAALRPFIAPFFAPGIMYNTIKSGIAVDYGVYTGSYEVVNNSGSTGGTLESCGAELYFVGRPISVDGQGRKTGQKAAAFDKRVPFEALINPGDYIINQPFVDMEPHPSASMNLTASWGGQGDPLYQMMINNFLAESINMFMPNKQMSSFVSTKESEFNEFQIGKIYGMRLKLRKSMNGARTYRNLEGASLDYPYPNVSLGETTIDAVAAVADPAITFSGVPAHSDPGTGGKITITDFAGIVAKATGTTGHTFKFTLIDALGAAHIFTINNEVNSTSNNVVGVIGLGSNAAVAEKIKNTVNDATSTCKNTILASYSGTDAFATFAQQVAGSSGNTQVLLDNQLSSDATKVNFSGGDDDGGYIEIEDSLGNVARYVPAANGQPSKKYSFPVGGDANTTAVALAARINDYQPNITATAPGSGVVDLAQDIKGPGGNTTITETASNTAVNNSFTGGISESHLRETFTMYSRPSAFGPPLAGRSFDTASPVTPATLKADPMSGYNPAYTPPYYDGEGWCDIVFKAFAEKHTLDEILSNAKLVHNRIDSSTWTVATSNSALRDFYPYNRSNVNQYAMQLTASINVLGSAKVNSITFTPDGTPTLVSDDPGSAESVWVIEPKFETPMFNFCPTSGSLRPITEADGNLSIPNQGKSTVPRGMWHQFGLAPDTPDKGIFMEIADIPQEWSKNRIPVMTASEKEQYYSTEVAAQRGFSSLIDQLNFNKTETRLGEVAESFEVSEAIVAVPFVTGADGERQFFEIPRQSLVAYQAIQSDSSAREAIEASGDPLVDLGNSIERQFELMKKYVIPPPFNCLEFDTVDPVAMYIFEFSHTFDKDDLSYMWQNLPPKAATKFEVAQASVSHPLLINELMGYASYSGDSDRAVQKDLQWMVFKVKQKAHVNYNSKLLSKVGTEDESFSVGFDFGGTAGAGVVEDIKYSYNWPYDYFSLVEFASIGASVGFADHAEDTPSNYIPESDES